MLNLTQMAICSQHLTVSKLYTLIPGAEERIHDEAKPDFTLRSLTYQKHTQMADTQTCKRDKK